MFGKKENSIVSTHLIVKVRKYHNLKPSFYLESTIADFDEANSVVSKLNDISLNHNIRCAYKDRVGFHIAGIGGQSWKKINKNQRIQNDLCSDLF